MTTRPLASIRSTAPAALAVRAKRVMRGGRRKALLRAVPVDPADSAKAARLRYVADSGAGIRRRRAGSGFRYVGPHGKVVRAADELVRIRSLAIPPAWTDVWISPDVDGHLQATGRDARGRKQYRYHVRWRSVRDETKYGRMIGFGEALPAIRARVDRDLELSGLPRAKVLATVARLMELTRIRVGNEEYAKQNESFGLTTLRDRHVDVSGARLEFQFKGKSGREHTVAVSDRRLARIVKRCQEIPGYELFQYVDENGERRSIDSADVNEYLREISGQDFTAKDFRTWAGTVLISVALRECDVGESKTATKKNLAHAIKAVAAQLGNTPAVCRKCYVHPAIIESYATGRLHDALERLAATLGRAVRGLDADEALVLAFLREAQTNAAEPLESKLRRSLDAAPT